MNLQKLPIDNLLIVRFNRQFANVDAEQFIADILLNKLNIKHLVIGDDFHFGKARRGNFTLLQAKGLQYGFTVEDTGSFLTDSLRVSSTLIRDALALGDLTQAKRLLGRSYSVCGRVAHGSKRGRQIGFPTANIKMLRRNTPVSGVFAVTMTGLNDLVLNGIANVGVRPTFDGSNTVLLETHLFDFNQEIYGRYVEVHFQHKIRDEMRFSSIDALSAQIHNDIHIAKLFFSGEYATSA
ncbi:riboflavin biosynthesis protein RibF [Methylocucumis oryzae]|uniref:riboflavin biosynthesis protein RibF n=1 Tax=Methylocucumis oryzae TaxID=1632867 RepID=UPI000AFAB897|nr:riboflavin biosynthesis protein RibF [Methylocucumis oryzae]